MVHCIIWCYSLPKRHPDPRRRPGFHDIRLVLSQLDQSILEIPDEDLSTHPQAGELGAEMEAGHNMYFDLQHAYVTIARI